MSIQSLESLETRCKSKEFSLRIYREVLPLLTPEEKWNLNQQMMPSSLSVPANVAEGYGRHYYQDNIRLCHNAHGSLEETLSHLVIAHEMNCIPKSLYSSLEQDGEKLTQLINGYIGHLKRSKKSDHEPGANLTVHDEAAPYDLEPTESHLDE